MSSVLLIGKNGSGKTAVGRALEVLQKIGQLTNRVGDLVKPADLARGLTDAPMRFEIEVELGGRIYTYTLAFELPKPHRELSVLEEKLTVDGKVAYTRDRETVHRPGTSREAKATFEMERNVVALGVIRQPSEASSVPTFTQWLAGMLILRPAPSLIHGDSTEFTVAPDPSVTDFGAWFSGLFPARSAEVKTDTYLKNIMPDFLEIENHPIGVDARSLVVHFANDKGKIRVPFADLSDGEKCFMICALVIATNEAYGPLLCFWDEPDNYLDLSEVQHFIFDLRKAFRPKGQFIATSHNPEAIRSFSDENTFLLYRNSRLDPTIVRRLEEIPVEGDLVSAIARGDLEP